MWKNEFRELLRADYEARKQKNPRTSLRSYAKRIGVSHSALLEIFSESPKWHPTPERAQKIANRLSLPKTVLNRLQALMGDRVDFSRQALAKNQPKYLTDWRYIPIMEAFGLATDERQPKRLADRFGLSLSEVDEIIEDLIASGQLERVNGEIRKTGKYWTTTDEVTSESIKKYHLDSLTAAGRALREIELNERDFTSLTFTGRKERLTEVKREIRSFLDKINALMEDPEEHDELYRMTICLFPLKFKKGRKH